MVGWFQVINGVAVLLESARGRSLVGMGLGHLTLERLLKLSSGVGGRFSSMKGYKNTIEHC